MRIDQLVIDGAALALLGGAMVLADTEGAILDANPAALVLYGYSETEISKLRVDDLYGDPQALSLLPADATPASTLARRKDGSTFPAEISSVTVPIEGEDAVLFLVRDISERTAADEALRASEEKFRLVANFAHDWEAWNGPDGSYQWVSPSCEEITGHTAEEFMADPDLTVKITHPDDLAASAEHHEIARITGQDADLEMDFRIVKPDGEVRWISHMCRAVYGDSGEWMGRRESNRDITARKNAEQAVLDARWRLESIIEGTHVGTWEWNVQTGESVFNERWPEMVGYTLEDLSPTGIHIEEELAHPDDLRRSNEELARHFAGETPYYDCELRLRHKDGHWVWVHDRGRVITITDDGKPLMMFGTHTDITERKQAEAQAERMLSLLESTMESTADAIVVTDGKGTIMNYNEKFANLWSLPRDILEAGDHEAALQYGKDQLTEPDRFVADVHRLNNDPEATSLDTLEFTDGRLVERYTQPQRIADRVVGRIWCFRDITERARAEENVERHAAQLAELLQEREHHLEQLGRSLMSIVEVVGRVVEARDPYTAGHQRRVAQLAVAIAELMEVETSDVEDIRMAALIHDIGKMSVPAEILSKPGVLSAVELALIQCHSKAGYKILSSVQLEGPIAEIVYQHHERCDGTGYPQGLTRDEMLPSARIIMVADVVEAMMSHRPYRAGLGPDAALDEIRAGAGTRYDAEVVDACTRVFRELAFEFDDD